MGPCDLQAVFDKLPAADGEFARLLETRDDAAVTQVADDLCLVQTVDFFTPIVDDPYLFGAIAAANALSDVYAMGATPLTAMNLVAWPPELGNDVLAEVLRGGLDKVKEAGAAMAGGHSIEDKEPKYGLAVMGLVHPSQVLTKGGARPGDILILTKPLGVGIVTTALKGQVAEAAHVAAAVASMVKLNRDAARLIRQVGVHACTDITGFGLLGHAYEMAERSAARLHFFLSRLPFVDGALGYAEGYLFPGGACRNQACYGHAVAFAPDIRDEMRQLLFTPETSGGLLAAIAADRLAELQALFEAARQPLWIVGEVCAGQGIEVVV